MSRNWKDKKCKKIRKNVPGLKNYGYNIYLDQEVQPMFNMQSGGWEIICRLILKACLSFDTTDF